MHGTQAGRTGAWTADLFSGGGEMGARMRNYDWSGTKLGPPDAWPQSLKTTVSILLTSRYAMWMAWGPDLTFFCNDAYEPTLGVKSDWAIGAPAEKVWSEIWNDVSPRIEHVLETGTATWDEGLLLFLERSGYPEETYHTFSYSPLRTDSGEIEGMLCVVTEETERVIGERRLTILRDLTARLSTVKSESEVAEALRGGLRDDSRDLPFTLTYLFEPDGASARLFCATGLPEDICAAPATISASAMSPWPVATLASGSSPVRLVDLAALGPLPTGGWAEPPRQALLRPIVQQGEEAAAGFLITAVNPFRRVDAAYEGFVALVAVQIAASLANARAYAEARHRAEALMELDRAKTAFFSNISHEFRTPLTLILGPLEELLAQSAAELASRERFHVEIAHRNSLRLLKLVNALLNFSRIEAGRMDAKYRPTDLAVLTAELASGFRSAMESAGLLFTVETPPLPASVFIDPDLWETIVLNLLSNAFKFTMQGGVTVSVGTSQDGSHAVLTVRDTGTGISATDLPRLFERFHRIEGTTGRTHEGSGIGLALVQELVALHGGHISVESTPGEGSSFIVSIPFGKAHLPPERVSDTGAGASDMRRAKAYIEEVSRWLAPAGVEHDPVAADQDSDGQAPLAAPVARLVLADDNADMRDYVRRLLGNAGYEVEAVADGQAALEAIERNPPELVLSDVMMPTLDGFGLLAAIRADERYRDIPILLLSARAGEEARVEGINAGADDYLTKPFSAQELVARVGANVSLARIRKEAVQTLRTLNETLETVVADRTRERDRLWGLSRELMVATTLDSTALATNPAWAEVLGWDEAALRGQKLLDLVHPEDLPANQAALASLADGNPSLQIECRMRRKDGSYRIVEWNAVIEAGIIYAVGRDVTDARAANERLRQSQKMETIGQLTGGVAHDFNNLLTVIVGNLETIRRNIGNADDAVASRLRHSADQAMRGADRATALTHRLLAFARRQPLDPKPIDVNRLILGMSDLMNRTLGDHVSVETVVAARVWTVHADAHQLENALLNLAVNARDAMPGGGKLTIETCNTYLDDAYTSITSEVTAGQYVLIAVSDTGSGMSKDLLDQVFEPFFTTKDVGHGTGLGLSQVYGFVKQSGGHVKIYSEVGEGTTVKIYLPRLVGANAVEEPEQRRDEAPKGATAELVMVVEDDDDVRAYSTDALRDLGYRVLEARDGASALKLLEREPGIRLLFTDVGLPGGMNGRQLANDATAMRPGLQVLFATGYARNAIVHGGRLDPGVQLITKPFTYSQLASKVRDVLDNARRPSRILVVEDEPLVSMMAVETLVDAGFQAEEAASGAEAIARLQDSVESIDAVILDMRLPDRSGDDLAREMRTLRPDLPVVIASGYDKPHLEKLFAQDRRIVVVAKPYLSNDLRDALRRVGVLPARDPGAT